MSTHLPIAVVGGGPAGSLAAELLARGGREVLLFDEKLAWEKPCGGGLTHKALTQYPFLRDSTASKLIRECELASPRGRRVRFELAHPIAIFSRLTLNGLLLERARSAGVQVRQERVTTISRDAGDWCLQTRDCKYPAASVILAAGARSSLRAHFASAISTDDLMVTAGYFIPGEGTRLEIQFLQGLSGYIWVFPRPGHVSAGIAAKMGETTTAILRTKLEQWLGAHGFSLEGARFYSHILPAFRLQTLDRMEVCGEGWMIIGDSAGLVDPITGEGLYYALRSAELCAEAILAENPALYEQRLDEEIIAELRHASRVSHRFYTGLIFGESVLETMISLTEENAGVRELMSDLFAGIQGYQGLRTRLMRIAPGLMLEGIAGKLGFGGGAPAPIKNET